MTDDKIKHQIYMENNLLVFFLSNCIFLSIKAIKMYFKFILLSEKNLQTEKIKIKISNHKFDKNKLWEIAPNRPKKKQN